MSDMQLGPTSSLTTLENPSYDSSFTETIDRSDLRTRRGGLFSYVRTGSWNHFEIPATFVSSSNRSLINSWWKTATDLDFIPNSDFPSSKFTVRIVGNEEPYTSFVEPYFQIHYQGTLILETI